MLRWIGWLAAMTALGCSSPFGPEADSFRHYSDVTFRLDGAPQRGDYVSGHVAEGGFGITADDYAGYGHLGFWVEDWPGGAGAFDLVPGGEDRAGEYVGPEWIDGSEDPTFSTARYGGSGRVSLRSAPVCRTSSGRDFVTGLYGTTTFCTLEGTFEFTARNARGAEVRITDGRFRVTLRRR